MDMVVFTVSEGERCVTLRTRRTEGIEEKDRALDVKSYMLFDTMDYLSVKYNSIGMAVVFDVE